MIQNEFLEQIPNLVAGNSVTIPSHLTFSSDDITPAVVDTSLSGEAGSRIALSDKTVDNNSVTFRGVRSSTVPPYGGTYLNVSGIFNSSTGGQMWASALLSSLLHTSSFDLEIKHTVRFDRL